MDPDVLNEAIPLHNVNSATLKKVIQWCQYHKDDPPPAEDETKEMRTDEIPSWDSEFLKVDVGTLFELILAANYLDIKGLLDVTCKTVANMITGKTTEQIRQIFNITNDLTKEEEAEAQVSAAEKARVLNSIFGAVLFSDVTGERLATSTGTAAAAVAQEEAEAEHQIWPDISTMAELRERIEVNRGEHISRPQMREVVTRVLAHEFPELQAAP